jgi:hypothetical protein
MPSSNDMSSVVNTVWTVGGFSFCFVNFQGRKYNIRKPFTRPTEKGTRIVLKILTAVYRAAEQMMTLPTIDNRDGLTWKKILSKSAANIICIITALQLLVLKKELDKPECTQQVSLSQLSRVAAPS